MGPVQAKWFCRPEDGGKIKLNWFLYELALEVYGAIQDSKPLSAYRKARTEQEIAIFSAYVAKRMKKSVLDRLAGLDDATVIDEEYISDYYPEQKRKLHQLLLDAACVAWQRLLSVCPTCPTRCLSERYRKTPLFDEAWP